MLSQSMDSIEPQEVSQEKKRLKLIETKFLEVMSDLRRNNEKIKLSCELEGTLLRLKF